MSYQRRFTLALADALINGPWTIDQLTRRLIDALGSVPPWRDKLLQNVYAQFESVHSHVKREELARFICADSIFQIAWSRHRGELRIRSYTLAPEPSPVVRLDCDLPPIENQKSLARWLGLSLNQLDGFADIRGMERRVPVDRMRHYHYRWKTKNDGRHRLLEIPKSRLRNVQRQIHRGILNRIPLHEACHGFRGGHSCLTYSAPHAGKRVVIRMDLEGFFTAITLRRIHALFTTVGYRSSVARQLAGICCNQVPHEELAVNDGLTFDDRRRYATPHLPQGAPSSPTLANLCAFRLDMRLASLAKSLDASYTRYADDLAFSGGPRLECGVDRFHALLCHIAADEGFSLNTRKTRVMRQGISQRLTGIVVNNHPNYPRGDYDRLKAILYNCVRYGPESQNKSQLGDFRSHLLGRISHVRAINPQRAGRLLDLFDRIQWNQIHYE